MSIAMGTTANPTSIDNVRYTYDANANRTQRQDAAGIHIYGYDNINQLTNVTYYDNHSQQYGYDLAGNRITFHDGVTSYSSTFNDLNQLTETRISASVYGEYSYDLDGNTTSITRDGNTWTLSWNAENRLRAASSTLTGTGTPQAASYKYYDDGYLAERIQGSDVVKYINDGMYCVAKYNGSGSLIEEYVYGANVDEVLCRITANGTWYFYHQDALQSVVAVTDESGSALATYQYDVFGKVRSQTGTMSNEILFTGRWLDSSTGFYNYRARWYDGRTGRFLSRDPIGVSGGVNLYGYVGNGVVNRIDPKGLFLEKGSGGEIGLIYSEGFFTLTCCDEKNRKHQAEYHKKCWGLYGGISYGGAAISGLRGRNCPRGYEGIFYEASVPTPILIVGIDLAFAPNPHKGPNAAGPDIGISVGMRRCVYTLINDFISGCCDKR